jgi:hypothetical protein
MQITEARKRSSETKIEIAALSTAGWLPITPTSRCGDGDLYILRNDVAFERWELTFFRRRPAHFQLRPDPLAK